MENNTFFKTERERLWNQLKKLNELENAYNTCITDFQEFIDSDKNDFPSAQAMMEKASVSNEIYSNKKIEYEKINQ